MTRQAGHVASYKVVFIVAAGRSGSVFLHSLFDGHPQVLTYPAVHALYSPWYSPELVATVQDAARFLERFTRLSLHFRGLFDEAIGRLGPDGSRNLTVDREAFLPLFEDELAGLGPPVTRAKMVLALHTAWGRLRGFEFGGGRVLVEHVHNPAFLRRALEDFPGAQTLSTFREPSAAYYGMIDFCLKTYGHFKHEFFFKFTRDVMITPWVELAPRVRNLPDRHRDVLIEELNARGREAMRELAAWIGIEDHEALGVSTIDGLLCHGNSGRLASVTTFRPGAGATAPVGSALERRRLALLLGDEVARKGYPPLVDRRRPFDALALLVPLRSELRPRPLGTVRDAIYDARCFPLAEMLLYLVEKRQPRLYDVLRRCGFARRGGPAHRLLGFALLQALVTKRLAFDPLAGYVARVRLFLATHREQRRRGTSPAAPGAGGAG